MRVYIRYKGVTYARGFWEYLWWGYLYFYRFPVRHGIMREENEPHPSEEIIKEIRR